MSSAPTPGKNEKRGAPREFALPPSMRTFRRTRQTASLPYPFLRML
jgi:hypothetical protein